MMITMNAAILTECLEATFDGRLPFPEVVGRMMETGVAWYLANLVTRTTQHFSAAGECVTLAWPEETVWGARALVVAPEFDAAAVVAAIRASQAGLTHYPEFLARAAAAGVTHYTVHLGGRRAVYVGQSGEMHVEWFPGAR